MMILLWIVCLETVTVIQSSFAPVITNVEGLSFKGAESDGGFYRNILTDSSNKNAYIGARNYIYKLSLNKLTQDKIVPIATNKDSKPNFGHADTMADTALNKNSEVYKLINIDLNIKQKPIQLMATEKLSQVYKLGNITYEEQCIRQIKILKLYYGDHLSLPLDDPRSICTRHGRALAWLDAGQSRLFALKNGLFGTMPVAPTGVTDYDKGFPEWWKASSQISLDRPRVDDMFVGITDRADLESLFNKVASADRTCYSCNYSKSYDKCVVYVDNKYYSWCYREHPIPQYMATNYMCDYTPAPTRMVLDANSMSVNQDGVLPATTKESCSGGNLASTLLIGYHPDQITKSITSETGNGPGGGRAIYILSEIGQEKQLDVNHEAFMGYEEPLPLTSSASLALVRLLVKGNGDIDSEKIVVSNPFKETWVTSPLTKFGRLVKTGNQATVPLRPRAVTLLEDEGFIYIFFREVEWEGMGHPEYSVNRHHFLWKSYDRTISYPWEKPSGQIKQPERGTPAMFVEYSVANSPEVDFTKMVTNEHVYAPHLKAFKRTWDNSKMISRVARVCKNDPGLPLGVQDASIFNLDNKLSLNAFQTFLKTKLTCVVRLKAVPRSWRLREDKFSFFHDRYWAKSLSFSQRCEGTWGCVTKACGMSVQNYSTETSNLDIGPFCEKNKKGKDVTFRAFLDYSPQNIYYINKDGLFQTTVSGWSQYHWAYKENFPTYSSVAYEYTELRDAVQIGPVYYGVFTSPHSESLKDGFPIPAATAICQFSMDDIRSAFSGPFKKRINNAWRPYSVGDDNPISPNPYSCTADPVQEEAAKIRNMDIEFTDETLPLEEELKNFDMRNKSQRLNFFEKDVEGSRTMWNSVEANPIFTTSDYQYDKIVAQQHSDVTIAYLTTTSGQIHKLAIWRSTQTSCWQPSSAALEKWWNEETNLKNNSWGVNYFNLTQEADAKDRTFVSEWKCTPSHNYTLLSIYKPFKDDTKIWDIKIAGENLLVATDTEVRSIPLSQCEKYVHCTTCSRDPHCGWDRKQTLCLPFKAGLIRDIKNSADCTACLQKTVSIYPDEAILLSTTLSLSKSSSLDQFLWYHNGSKVEEKEGRHVLTRNNSLMIINGRGSDEGLWELRDLTDQTCIVQYILTLKACESNDCKYKKQLNDWCDRYDSWANEMYNWQDSMAQSGCIK